MSRTKLASLHPGKIQFVTPVVLASTADVTSAVFRDMCLEFPRQGLPVKPAHPEVEQGKGQITRETEVVAATRDVTMSANKSTVAMQVYIKATIDTAPRPNVPGKARMEGTLVGEMVTAKTLRVGLTRSWAVVESGSL